MKLVCFTLLMERRCDSNQNQDEMDVVFGYLVNPVIRVRTRGTLCWILRWSESVPVGLMQLVLVSLLGGRGWGCFGAC